MTRPLHVIILPLEGGESVSREVDLPEYVNAQAVLEATVFHIRDLWGEEKDHEIIDRHERGLP